MRSPIYQVLCPAYSTSGGPEALHQFVHVARRGGLDARIYYYDADPKSPKPRTADQFRCYDVAIDEVRLDQPGVVLISPETQTQDIVPTRYAKRAIWWLSIDNYWRSLGSQQKRRWNPFSRPKTSFKFSSEVGGFIHLAQSAYAHQYLASRVNDPVLMLTDYLRADFLQAVQNLSQPPARRPVVTYNPKKGWETTRAIIECNPGIEFVRIENMSPSQVHELLSKSMVYMDFGEHPGRDRIPREAAACGCVLLTGRQGSAANDVDVPIPDELKLDEQAGDFLDRVSQTLTHLIQHYPAERARLADYRRLIAGQEATFAHEIETLHGHVTAWMSAQTIL